MSQPSPYLKPEFQHLHKEYDAVVQCNRCGFCETVCPTYMATGNENSSPRGRNQAFRQILEGKMTDPQAAQGIFDSCLTCHACTNACYSQVPVGRLMGYARDIASASQTQKRALQKIIFQVLLRYRFLFSVLVWPGFLAKRLGLAGFLQKTGILKIISPELHNAVDLVQHVPLQFGAGKAKANDGSQNPKTIYFSGCGTHYVYPKACKDFLNVLKKNSAQVQCPSHSCCGLIPQSAGDIASAKVLARSNIQRLNEMNADAIVVNDDSCCGYMKSYPQLLDGDLQAMAFAAKVKNLSEFLAAQPQFKPKPVTSQRIKVTYHDPCQIGNGHKLTADPRNLLKSLPNVDFVEMDEANWCCGGAGTYALKNPDLADQVLERKLHNIKQTKAAIVITQASSCLIHVQYGLRQQGLEKQIQVMHLAEFLEKFSS